MSNKPLNTNFGDALPPRDLGSSEPWGRAIEKRIKDLERLSASVRLAVNNQSRSASAMAARVQAQVSKDKEDEEDAKINDIEAQERAIRHETRLTEVADELDEMTQILNDKLEALEGELEDAEDILEDLENNILPGMSQDIADAIQNATDAITAANSAVIDSEVQYAVGNSSSSAPTSGWSTSQPSWTPGNYVWMRTKVTYGDNSTTFSSPSILTGPPGGKGDPGEPGAGIEIAGSVDTYGDLPGGLGPGDSGEAYLVKADGKLYIWDGSSFPASGSGVEFRGPKGDDGDTGDPGSPGVSVDSVTPYFRMAASKPSQPSGSSPSGWSTSEPSFVPGQKLWRSERIALSDSSYQWTPVTQVEAYTVAANLQQTIDDGLMRVAPESNPPTPAKGLTWLVVDENDSSKAIGLKVANSNGSGWGSYQIITEDLMVIGPNGTVRLKDGVVGADQIIANEVAAEVGDFLTLRTDQLTVTGSAGVNELVANEIWAKKIAAQKVLANEVLIGGQVNRVPNGSGTLLDASSGWALDSTGLTWATGGGPSSTPGYWSTSERYTHGSSTNFVEGASFEIDAGTVSIGLWVRRTSSVASGNFVFRLLGLGGFASSPSRIEGFNNSWTANAEMWASETTLPVNTWVWCEGTFNVSEPRIVMVNIQGGASASRYDLAGISVKSLIDHNLIVDGGILARNIATQALTVDHVITGALYQTTSLANRGVKIDSTGFKAYNNSGTQTVNITNTGNATITGELHSGTGTDRVSILPNVKVSGTSRPGILFQRGAISGTRQYPYVAGTDETGTSEGLFLSSGSLPTPSTTSFFSLRRSGTITLLGYNSSSSGAGEGIVTSTQGLSLFGALPSTGDGSESIRVERSDDISPGGFYRVSYDPRPIGNVASFAIPRGTATALNSNPRVGSVSSTSYTTVYHQRDNSTSIQAYILHAWGRDSRI